MSDTRNESGGPYVVKYTVWEKSDAATGRDGGHTGDQRTFTGFYNEPSKMACINTILYEIRGVKSKWELAYVDEIQSAEGPADA